MPVIIHPIHSFSIPLSSIFSLFFPSPLSSPLSPPLSHSSIFPSFFFLFIYLFILFFSILQTRDLSQPARSNFYPCETCLQPLGGGDTRPPIICSNPFALVCSFTKSPACNWSVWCSDPLSLPPLSPALNSLLLRRYCTSWILLSPESVECTPQPWNKKKIIPG